MSLFSLDRLCDLEVPPAADLEGAGDNTLRSAANLNEYTTAVIDFVSKCVEDCVPKNTICVPPNWKSLMNREVYSQVKARSTDKTNDPKRGRRRRRRGSDWCVALRGRSVQVTRAVSGGVSRGAGCGGKRLKRFSERRSRASDAPPTLSTRAERYIEGMWSESRSQCGERNQRGHFHPGRPHNAEFQRTVQVIQRRLDCDHGRGEGGRGDTSRDCNYYNHSDTYRGYSADNRDSGHGRRFGPPLKTSSWDGENSKWPRDEHSGSRLVDYRGTKTKRYADDGNRDNSRRKNFYISPHVRERSPHKREAPYYRRESPHSHSGSSISSRSHSPEKSKQLSSYQSQYVKSKRSVCAMIPSRDESPSISVPPVSSKSTNFDKSTKTCDNLNKDIETDWSSEQQQIPELEINEPDTDDAIQMLLPDNLDDLEMNTLGAIDILDLSQTDHRTRTIAEKTKEIEEVYRQDCETFGMVVQMLIDKDPSLENTTQFALRENLREIGERCIEELRTFITQYDSAPGEHIGRL
ncbi:periphilin-1 [Rhinoraja longicauda]